MDLGSIIQKIQQLPTNVQEVLLKNLKLSEIDFKPAGAVLIAMQLLSLLGVGRMIDQLLEEEHTSIECLKAEYDLGRKPVPSTGTVICIVIADMLASPAEITRIYKFEKLAHEWLTGPLLGICPTLLNDDRIGRALSKLGNCEMVMKDTLQMLTLHVAERYNIPLSRFFIDTTLIQLDGEFAKAAKVTAGRGRDSFSQLIISLACVSGSRLPIGFGVHAGNTNDGTVLPSMFEAISAVSSSNPLELIFDRAFPTAKNLYFLQSLEQKCFFIAPLQHNKAGETFRTLVFKGYDENTFLPINYSSAEDIKKKRIGCYKAYETEWNIDYVEKPELLQGETRRPRGSSVHHTMKIRCVIYRDEQKARIEKENKDIQLLKCDMALEEFAKKINKRKLTTLKACQDKAGDLLKSFPAVKSFVKLNFNTNKHGAVVFSWSLDKEKYEREKCHDGIFALITTHDKNEVSAVELLKRYRDRNQIEMDFNALKGLLELEEVYLQLPKRIEAYTFLKVLAYFVLAFLRWYMETHGKKKVTEKKIQETFSRLSICKQEVLPLHIPHWSVSREEEMILWIRTEFGLSDYRETIERMNVHIDKDKIIKKWFYGMRETLKC